ncbi:hypothetical protein K1719_039090 [Acacia pycnantha]|nr:hypothetical protein K1719_039090 [Acacia pycnantha]
MASKSQFSKGSSTVRKITQLNNDRDAESENGNSGNLATYTVHLPPTPDNQPVKITMEISSSRRVEDQYASSSMFTGGFNQKLEPYKQPLTVANQQAQPLSPSVGLSKIERRSWSMNSKSGALMKSQTNELDHNQWLYETKGSYGYGNAMWPKEPDNDSAAILSPYRLLIFVRMAVLAFFLKWRVENPNNDALWLWLCPINRFADLDVLKEKFETPNPSNPTGKSDLRGRFGC